VKVEWFRFNQKARMVLFWASFRQSKKLEDSRRLELFSKIIAIYLRFLETYVERTGTAVNSRTCSRDINLVAIYVIVLPIIAYGYAVSSSYAKVFLLFS